jgi:hypothetical protein
MTWSFDVLYFCEPFGSRVMFSASGSGAIAVSSEVVDAASLIRKDSFEIHRRYIPIDGRRYGNTVAVGVRTRTMGTTKNR